MDKVKDAKIYKHAILLTSKLRSKDFWVEWWPLLMIILILTASYIYGALFDPSIPRGGLGWADQNLYRSITESLKNGEMLNRAQLHFTIGYPLLGVMGSFFFQNHPFLLIGYLLLITSSFFCYLGAKKILGKYWALLFCLLLFAWDGVSRTTNYAQEIFNVPWNNQVLFFTFSFFFWLFITQLGKKASWPLVAVVSVISGYTFLTREEAVLFVLPITLLFLFITKSGWRKILLSVVIIFACFVPQMYIKNQVAGSATTSARAERGYGKIIELYSNPRRLSFNVRQTIIRSEDFSPERRASLMEAAPWLWLSPVGFGFILFARKRYPLGVKLLVLFSIMYTVFYLMGDNMRPTGLKFHNLRYISAAFVMLNFSVIVAIREISLLAEKKAPKKITRA